ncbi:MAG: 2-succinyl-5-enolpyruvyl-6-hydroxy-3-cyclohexene-1-carboxylic-acid synthase [Deltaproteobacteria bacterium]|nr:2-succinyl-5-enolpyruvyl-6-hydroxy-3-cyclohexene-1-carboxylic-acid synthase [Deltaproteobacteria bacterium]
MGAEQHASLTAGHLLHLFVGSFVDELARAGVSHVCLCPGSRSTPLALLLRKHPSITVWTHVDERSAAFFALGIAKALGEPVAVVSTSGTAAVNFAPAVVEAYYAHVSLLVLTADRPPELRHVGALQTIDQVRLFGPHVKWFVEMPLPDATEETVRYARTIACRAAATARADGAGPVHINFPFREPLIPNRQQAPSTDCVGPSVAIVRTPRRPDRAELADLAADVRAVRRGLIVCGPQDDLQFPPAVARLAEALDWPLLADPLSQTRCGGHHNRCIIDSYDAFLRTEEVARLLAPELVLRFGATPVSKPLLQYLQRHAACRQILIDGGDGWHDPALTASEVRYTHPRLLCETLLSALPAGPQPSRVNAWKDRWVMVGERTRATLQAHLRQSADFSEPRVFVELGDLLPPGATLVAGNSMPVRDLDTFFPGNSQTVRFLANRGASGIDGVVSTALGVSAVSPGPMLLTIGDLSFYHDLNGLLAAKQHQLRATIVLLQNDGGGIFSFLPQAQDQEHFEELFGTPHGLDFRPAAEMYGLDYQRPADWEEFRTAVRRSLDAPGVTLIEVRTERRANVELHRRLWEAVSQSVGKSLNDGRPA